MTSVLRKSASQEGVVLNARYKWVEFTTDDDQLIRAKVRSSLLYDEVDKLVGLNMVNDREELWKATAPYVMEWNVKVVQEEDGEDVFYDIIPPHEGGPESWRYAPPDLVYAIVGSLINEPFRKVDPKSSTPVEPTAKP